MVDIETPRVAAPVLVGRARTIALWVVLLAFFVDILDTTIVNVAIPSIQADLGASYSSIQWIVAGYALTFALFLITGGRLGDIYGYRTLFLLGMAGFTIASLLSGLASDTEMLIVSRLLQGFAAATMVPQILATIQVMFPSHKERQNVSAFYGALAGIATVFGPIAGALLISGNIWGLSWRPIFLINLPVGVAAIILGFIFLPKAKSSRPLRLDWLGVGLTVWAMLLLMYPLIQGRELDWPWWTFVSIAVSALCFLLFARTQIGKENRGDAPLVPPHLFRTRSFSAGVFVIGAFFAIVSGFFLILTLFLQIGLGYSVLKAGLTSIPFSVGVSVAAGSSGPLLVPRFGRVIVSAGPAVMAAGFVLFILTIDHFGGGVTPWELIPAQLISGIGMGFVVAPVYSFVLAEVPLKDAGSASGVVSAISQIGGAIGVAAIGVIFFGAIGNQAADSFAAERPALAADLTAQGVPAFAQPQILDSVAQCFRDRSNAKDFSALPESCQQGQKSLDDLASTQPAAANAVRATITAHALDANKLNFIAALEHAMTWLIAAMAVVFLVTFLLPRRPRDEAAEGGAAMPM